jgi:hypothetical protein
MDREQIELLSKAEELLSHARDVSRRIEKRTRKLMQEYVPPARLSRDGPPATAAAERKSVLLSDTPTAH